MTNLGLDEMFVYKEELKEKPGHVCAEIPAGEPTM